MNLRAFTLVETLIAVAVLSFAILGPFHVSQTVLQSAYVARDELIATALAQEGVEYVHNLRDSNFLVNANGGSRTWLYGMDGSTGVNCYSASNGNKGCVVDPTNQTVIVCADATCSTRPLYLSAANLYNQQTTGTQTKFTRTVTLTAISATETVVTVTVSWTSHTTYSVVLTDTLRNWL